MLKTLLATSALASMLAWGAVAQTAPGDVVEETTPPRAGPDQAPSVQNETEPSDGPVLPQAADEPGATPGAAPEPEGEMAADPAEPPASPGMAPEPEGEMAADPAEPAATPGMAPEPEGEMAADPAEPAAEPEGQMTAEPAAPADAPALPEGWSEVDVATITTDSLIGADIQTYDQQKIAQVQEVVMSAAGQPENVVARFGGFLGFGETTVLLGTDQVSFAKDPDGKLFVLTAITPDELKTLPEYTPPETQPEGQPLAPQPPEG
jgi:PRC-barrel domain